MCGTAESGHIVGGAQFGGSINDMYSSVAHCAVECTSPAAARRAARAPTSPLKHGAPLLLLRGALPSGSLYLATFNPISTSAASTMQQRVASLVPWGLRGELA